MFSAVCSASSAAPSKAAAWKLRVGRALMALKVSRLASVPSSRYFAVAGPNDRSRRSRAAARTAAGSGHLRPSVDRDRLQVLRTHDRAQPAAARVPPVVRDRGVPDAALAGRPDRRHPPAGTELAAQMTVRISGGHARQVRGAHEPGPVAVHDEDG
jgi:hypothetical protein